MNYWFFSYENELKMNTEGFENLTFNTFDNKSITLNDSFDLDSNFFNTHGFNNAVYFTPETLKAMMKENNDIPFSDLHFNFRSLNKNFESLKNLLVEINFCFKVIYITEAWCSDDLHFNDRYQLPNYVSIHQVRKNGKTNGGMILVLMMIPKLFVLI